jgi:aquaporin related protein
LIQFIGEFLGTFMFLFFAFAAANVALQDCKTCGSGLPPSISELLYISLAFGFSLAVNAWVFFRISGGLFNPAVTLGLMLIGCLTWLRAGVVITAQLLGAIAASAVVKGLFPYVSPPAGQLAKMSRCANPGRSCRSCTPRQVWTSTRQSSAACSLRCS